MRPTKLGPPCDYLKGFTQAPRSPRGTADSCWPRIRAGLCERELSTDPSATPVVPRIFPLSPGN
jgi:hypothetical protein